MGIALLLWLFIGLLKCLAFLANLTVLSLGCTYKMCPP